MHLLFQLTLTILSFVTYFCLTKELRSLWYSFIYATNFKFRIRVTQYKENTMLNSLQYFMSIIIFFKLMNIYFSVLRTLRFLYLARWFFNLTIDVINALIKLCFNIFILKYPHLQQVLKKLIYTSRLYKYASLDV